MECGMERRFHRGFTAAEKTELWDRWKRLQSVPRERTGLLPDMAQCDIFLRERPSCRDGDTKVRRKML
jgi:hypothetical protein